MQSVDETVLMVSTDSDDAVVECDIDTTAEYICMYYSNIILYYKYIEQSISLVLLTNLGMKVVVTS